VRYGRETILIVDDEESVLGITDRMLSSGGYKTLKAASGKKAIQIFRENRSEIDLTVLDMLMPDMDGHKVCNEIKKLDQDARIIFTSGFIMNENDETSKNIVGFIQKPFHISLLLDTIRKALDGKVLIEQETLSEGTV